MSREENESTLLRLTMIVVLAVFMLVCCSGCTTAVPVTAKFPEVPDRLLVQCPQLRTLPDNTTLSEMTETVNQNYATYYDCSSKLDGFIEWYQTQKPIFDNAGK